MKAKAAAVATATARQKANASLKVRDLRFSILNIQFETDSAHIHDVAAPAVRIELTAKIADLHVDDVGLREELEIPHFLEEHPPGHDLPGVPHEIFEQPEFAREQRHRLARAGHRAFD